MLFVEQKRLKTLDCAGGGLRLEQLRLNEDKFVFHLIRRSRWDRRLGRGGPPRNRWRPGDGVIGINVVVIFDGHLLIIRNNFWLGLLMVGLQPFDMGCQFSARCQL